MEPWYSFSEQAKWQILRIEGDRWKNLFENERGKTLVEIVAREIYLYSLKPSQSSASSLDRYNFANSLIVILRETIIAMKGETISSVVRDDIQSLLIIVGKQTDALSLERQTPPSEVK